MEYNTQDNVRWPYLFEAPSMDRSQASHLGNPRRLPWLVGIDGRHRGALHSYPGHTYYGEIPVKYWDVSIQVIDQPASGVSITIGTEVLTEGVDWNTNSSTAVVATNIGAAISSRLGRLVNTVSVQGSTISFRLILFLGESVPWTASSGDFVFTPTAGTLQYSSGTPTRDILRIDFLKYGELRKTGNTILRGVVARDSRNGLVVFAYNDGSSSDDFTAAFVVDESRQMKGLQMDVSYAYRVLYVVGTDGTKRRARVAYYDEDTAKLVSAAMGPMPDYVPPSDPDADTDTKTLQIYLGQQASKSIGRMDINGGRYETFQTTTYPSVALVLDAAASARYLFAGGWPGPLVRFGLDKANDTEVVLLSGTTTRYGGLTVDPQTQTLYYTLSSTGTGGGIRSIKYDGTSPTTIYATSGAEDFREIEYHNGYLYWFDLGSNRIEKAVPTNFTATRTTVRDGGGTTIQHMTLDRKRNRVLFSDNTISPGPWLFYVSTAGGLAYALFQLSSPTGLLMRMDEATDLLFWTGQTSGGTPDLAVYDMGTNRRVGYYIPPNMVSGYGSGLAIDSEGIETAAFPMPIGNFFRITTTSLDVNDIALSAGWYELRVRYWDSIRNRYSPISKGARSLHGFLNEAAINTYYEYLRLIDGFDLGLDLPSSGYTKMELYTTTASGTSKDNTGVVHYGAPGGILYRRAIIDIPPSDTRWHFHFGTNSTYSNSSDPPIHYTDFMSDLALVQQEAYDPIRDYVAPSVPHMESLVMYQGTHFALVPAQGYLDIRWTPLDRFEPENFQALNAKRTQMGTNGKAGFIRAGDVLWVLGDSESYRLQKVGFNLSIHRMLEGYEFVGKYCGVAVGNSIIAVTTTGVLQINGNTGQFTQISGLDRIILKRWANNLSPSGGEAKIYVTADSQLGAVFIWNRAVGECAVLWTTTNRITLLTDCWYRWAATVYLPNNREAGRRTLFVQEKQEYEYPTAQTGSAGGSALFHPTFGLPSSPTMMGVTQGGTSAKDVTNLVFQASAITTNAEGVTEITVPTSSTTTPAGRYVGAVLYPLTGSLAGTGYKVLRSSPASGGGVKLQLSADITSSLTTSDYLSLSPVVVGFVGWPLGSRSYGQDLLSRRVVDSMVTVLGAGKTGMAGGTNYGLFKYGLARYEDLADDTVLGAASTDPMTDPARPLPWTPTWEVEAGKDYTLDLSRPEGLYTAIQGDGGLVLPTFRCVVSGIWFTILAQFLFGRIEPNDALQST